MFVLVANMETSFDWPFASNVGAVMIIALGDQYSKRIRKSVFEINGTVDNKPNNLVGIILQEQVSLAI